MGGSVFCVRCAHWPSMAVVGSERLGGRVARTVDVVVILVFLLVSSGAL